MYASRTGDYWGANHMLAVRAPGQSTDIAPEWLISEATTYSKSEYQRSERVRALARQQDQRPADPKRHPFRKGGKGGQPGGGGAGGSGPNPTQG